MRPIFVDSSYYIALMSGRDGLHARALELSEYLKTARDVSLTTTDAVLVEVLTRASKFGPHSRTVAAAFAQRVTDDPRVVVLPQSGALFDAGLDLYRHRTDKAYSMTDCMSMVVCRDRRIREVLTADHDFEQEGFAILL